MLKAVRMFWDSAHAHFHHCNTAGASFSKHYIFYPPKTMLKMGWGGGKEKRSNNCGIRVYKRECMLQHQTLVSWQLSCVQISKLHNRGVLLNDKKKPQPTKQTNKKARILI